MTTVIVIFYLIASNMHQLRTLMLEFKRQGSNFGDTVVNCTYRASLSCSIGYEWMPLSA